MTPAQAIVALDRQLGAHGETVVWYRGVLTVPCWAIVRGYRPQEISGDIEQGDRAITLSPTALGALTDGPRRGDRLALADGTVLNCEDAVPVRVDNVIVRWNARGRG